MMHLTLREHLVDLVYPSQCAGCGRPHPAAICGPCWRRLALRAVGTDADIAALARPVAFDGYRSGGEYRGAVKDMVLRLKDSERRMAGPLACLMLVAAGNDPRYLAPDAIACVPSTRPKIARRGYNPARALALEYAALTGAPLIDVLAVARKTTDQDAIPGHSRWANVEEAFAADGPVPQGRIILVDDVVTTGATADACSRVLRREGAVSVHLLVAARAVLRRVAITASSARITQ